MLYLLISQRVYGKHIDKYGKPLEWLDSDISPLIKFPCNVQLCSKFYRHYIEQTDGGRTDICKSITYYTIK